MSNLQHKVANSKLLFITLCSGKGLEFSCTLKDFLWPGRVVPYRLQCIRDVKSISSNLFKWVRYCYRPQTKFAKVMFSQVFVCPQGSLSRGSLVRGISVKGGGSLWPGESLASWVSGQGGLCPGGLCQGDPSYGKERAVRILLECILVHEKGG